MSRRLFFSTSITDIAYGSVGNRRVVPESAFDDGRRRHEVAKAEELDWFRRTSRTEQLQLRLPGGPKDVDAGLPAPGA